MRKLVRVTLQTLRMLHEGNSWTSSKSGRVTGWFGATGAFSQMQNPSHTKAKEVGMVNREGERLVVSKISVKIAKAKKSLIAYTKIQESSNLQISIISPIWQLLTKLLKCCN